MVLSFRVFLVFGVLTMLLFALLHYQSSLQLSEKAAQKKEDHSTSSNQTLPLQVPPVAWIMDEDEDEDENDEDENEDDNNTNNTSHPQVAWLLSFPNSVRTFAHDACCWDRHYCTLTHQPPNRERRTPLPTPNARVKHLQPPITLATGIHVVECVPHSKPTARFYTDLTCPYHHLS
jgi:hypothetical protein